MFVIGSAGLLGAMATDFVGVVARHLGWSPLGLIEIVQLCVVGAISASIVVATIEGVHAAVRMVTERLPPPVARALERLSDLLGAALFAVLAVGSIWLLSDTYPLDERSDVLGLAIAPARMVWIAALIIAALVFLGRAVLPAPAPAKEPHVP